jgi:hypothetical protein
VLGADHPAGESLDARDVAAVEPLESARIAVLGARDVGSIDGLRHG